LTCPYYDEKHPSIDVTAETKYKNLIEILNESNKLLERIDKNISVEDKGVDLDLPEVLKVKLRQKLIDIVREGVLETRTDIVGNEGDELNRWLNEYREVVDERHKGISLDLCLKSVSEV
jgi:predicted translin family RNA/ssDNA-binding protein